MNKFNPGDILKVISEPDILIEITEIVNTLAGEDYRVNYISYPKDKDWLVNFNGSLFSKHRIENECELYSTLVVEKTNVDIKPPEFKKTCICISSDLFRKGCTCGAVKPYKQMWG